MPKNNTPSNSGTYSGGNGAKIFQQVHEDIDTSDIDISCVTGSAEVTLDERIWSTWKRRNTWKLKAGDPLNAVVDVDSDWYDGDHRLTVLARSNSTKCTVSFSSTDN